MCGQSFLKNSNRGITPQHHVSCCIPYTVNDGSSSQVRKYDIEIGFVSNSAMCQRGHKAKPTLKSVYLETCPLFQSRGQQTVDTPALNEPVAIHKTGSQMSSLLLWLSASEVQEGGKGAAEGRGRGSNEIIGGCDRDCHKGK